MIQPGFLFGLFGCGFKKSGASYSAPLLANGTKQNIAGNIYVISRIARDKAGGIGKTYSWSAPVKFSDTALIAAASLPRMHSILPKYLGYSEPMKNWADSILPV
jgi:hypothetical protein